jgi:hypothetical protein
LDRTDDRRVRQFVEGEAGERLMEMRSAQPVGDLETPDLHEQLHKRNQ